ncbi:sulfotransferase 6B1-like [Eleutherodactylus coqui]|uniref:sulfotransferase 6B1-like n=1 Tax=Eleutherodactylus coqui TaxID=57060 RepID=UPI003462DF95
MLFELHGKEPTLDQAKLEFGKPIKYENLNQQPSPRVLASHLNYENVPKTFFEKKTKILIIMRNPKGAAVSYYHFMNNNPVLPTYSSWDLFFKDFISGDGDLLEMSEHQNARVLVTRDEIFAMLEGSFRVTNPIEVNGRPEHFCISSRLAKVSICENLGNSRK